MFVDVSKWKQIPKKYFDRAHKNFGTKRELVVGEYYRSPYENDFLSTSFLLSCDKATVLFKYFDGCLSTFSLSHL